MREYMCLYCERLWAVSVLSQQTVGEMMDKLKIWHILLGMIAGMGLSALMAWNGGFSKLYNDIPSLVGYASMLLLVYKIGIKWVDRFFCYSKIGYEWYLVHSLTFIVVHHYMDGIMPMWMVLLMCLPASYAMAFVFQKCRRHVGF